MVDKECIQQVLGSLIKHPQYLSEIDKYNLSLSDFSSRFERYIFSAIVGLYNDGAIKISSLDIENYLKSDPAAAETFKEQNGIEYLEDIQDFVNEDNFPYYYAKLKKLNLLRDLRKKGIDTSDFYMDDLTNPKSLEINSKFENLTSKDILSTIKSKILKLEGAYVATGETEVSSADDGLEELYEDMDSGEDIGLPIQGEILSQILCGARLGTMTVRSAASGVGKTTVSLGDACLLAYPIRYNSLTFEWEMQGFNEKVLFIITEQTKKEVQRKILAYLTDINEDRFRYGRFNEEEDKRIQKAFSIMRQFKDNFTIVKMPEPTVEGLKQVVREQSVLKDIHYLFMDYIFISPALLREFKDFKLRNDEALLLLSTALKDLATELNLSVFTATQLNANGDNSKDIRNESSIAGARAIINKADNGIIMARPTKEELDIIVPMFQKLGLEAPNLVMDVYKVRSGKYTQVRVWSYMDYGTLKRKDLFLTDSRLNPIENFALEPMFVSTNWETTEFQEVHEMVERLNHD